MGQLGSKYTMSHLWKQDEPDCGEPIKYDPEFGFEGRPREELILITATKEEMDSAAINPDYRNECAHGHILLRGCKRKYMPFWFMCKEIEQELRDCYFDSRVRDMKEFERERRLNVRERRIREREAMAMRG